MNAILVAHDNNLSKGLFDSAWTYLAEAREQEELAPLVEQITNIPDYKETIMSYAETLKQQGIKQGMQQGMQQGKYEIVQEMLKAGAELSFIEKVSHLTKKRN